MNLSFISRIKPEYHKYKEVETIPIMLNENFISGDNEKYMKMYDWMSRGYDIAETVIGRLKYGSAINRMRSEIISKLDWKDNCSVLYVSIGTGKDLQFIPESINKKSLDFYGADISIGMLKQCRKKYRDVLPLTLVNCCA